jgi:hypothetical protein
VRDSFTMGLADRDYMKENWRDESASHKSKEYNGVQEKKVILSWHYKIRIKYFKIKDKIKEFPKYFSFSKIKKKLSILKSKKDYKPKGFSSSSFYDPRR